VLLAVGSIALLHSITNRFFGRSAARIGALLYAFWPNSIAYCGLLSCESLFTFGLLLVLWLGSFRDFIRTGFIGIAMGLIALVRPIALLLPIIFSPFEREQHEPWRFGFIRFIPICFVMGLVLLPWEMRNYNIWHHIVPVSTNGGINLYIGNNPQANGGYVIPESDSMWRKLMAEPNEAKRDLKATRAALDWIKANPLAFLKLVPIKFARFWVFDYSGFDWTFKSRYGKDGDGIMLSCMMLAQIYYLLLLYFAIRGIIWVFKERIKVSFIYLPMLIVAYWILVHIVIFGGDRFHFPMVPLLMIYASGFIANLTMLHTDA
jgi:hypothetical protein